MVAHIKDNWVDVTLGEFQQILDIQSDKVLDDFSKDLKKIEVLSDLNENEINSLPMNKLKPLLSAISFLSEEIKPVDLKDLYKVNNKEYKLVRDITQITGAQFTDLMALLQDKDQVNKNLHLIVGVLMAPMKKQTFFSSLLRRKKQTEKYLEHTTLDDIAEDMLYMSIVDIHSISNFFFALSVKFQAVSFSWVEKHIPMQLNEVLKTLKEKRNSNKEKLNQTEEALLQQIQLLLNAGIFGT
ncbi:MAG: hypothetical protein J0H29_13270 [Sphingobacteriales bacterium]|nr:hypothetical protein [Sphingobacteriales bacterium]